MASLWDDPTPNTSANANIETSLAIMTPDQMISYDLNAQELVHADTDALKESLEFCEQVVIAAYTVADYVPNLANNQHADFWKGKVSFKLLAL